MKIIAYKMVVINYYEDKILEEEQGKKCYLQEFIEMVNKEIENGWQPYGDMKIPIIEDTIPKIIQVMVKYDKEENNESEK